MASIRNELSIIFIVVTLIAEVLGLNIASNKASWVLHSSDDSQYNWDARFHFFVLMWYWWVHQL